VSDIVQQIDLVPTVLDLVRAPVPGDLRGRSLKPLLDGSGSPAETVVYSESLYGRYHFGWSEIMSLIDDRYQYVSAPGAQRAELYDLRRDTLEQSDISDAKPELRQQLSEALDRLAGAIKLRWPSELDSDSRYRLRLIGYPWPHDEVTATLEEPKPEPQDKVATIERYRTALDLAASRKWAQAITVLQGLLRTDPGQTELWEQIASYASRIERFDEASDAYDHLVALRTADPKAYIDSALVLARLRKFELARERAVLAADMAAEHDRRSWVAAHEALARIGLARRDAEAARHEAELVRNADPVSPIPDYVEGRLLYDQAQYDEAVRQFQQAQEAARKSRAPVIRELHFYIADSLVHLEQFSEAESEYLEELLSFPESSRARAGLASLYQLTGRTDEAAQAIDDLIQVTPTPETYSLAARLLTTFGDRQQAEAVRAEARRTFGESSRDATHGALR
jgi:tetratricopeptide (TPR) repeat protein